MIMRALRKLPMEECISASIEADTNVVLDKLI